MRGWIQLTGRANYTSATAHTGIDLIGTPEKAATIELSAQLACWFWQSRKLNDLAKQGTELAFKQITRRINGGLNGYDDRLKYWRRAQTVLLED